MGESVLAESALYREVQKGIPLELIVVVNGLCILNELTGRPVYFKDRNREDWVNARKRTIIDEKKPEGYQYEEYAGLDVIITKKVLEGKPLEAFLELERMLQQKERRG